MLRVQLSSAIPIYQQLVDEVKRLIAQRELREGDALPTIRALASQLEVAVNTVARAYQELDALGLTESRGSQGTFVKAARDGTALPERVFRDAIRRLLQRGLSRKQIQSVFERELAIFFD
jgi:DNA-binding transcriptional regulator YhcF (GntR family)